MTPLTTPHVSVVLSTFNRRALLMEALGCLLAQPHAPPHEILVIDNRSTDGTRDAVTALARDVTDGRLIYAYEARQGLSHARNAGIALARGPLIAFTDDDVLADPDWIAAVESAFARHPAAQYVGGRVLPQWQTPPPSWLTPAHWSPLALQDHGAEVFVVGPGRPLCLVGANMAFRADAFRTAGLFAPEVQLLPGTVGSTEDHELMLRVWEHGGHGVYDPSIVVRTRVQSERLTRRYHRRWHYGHGRSLARMRIPEMERSRGRLLDVPLHLYRQACRDLIDRLRAVIRRDAAAGFLAETRLCFFAGFVRERVARDGPAEDSTEVESEPRPPADPLLVSIVIPCYKQAAYLPESIGSALSQTYQPIEVVVVDDGSPDGAAAVAARYSVRCVRQANLGLARARNAGLVAARGGHVVFLDADDQLDPRAVEHGLAALSARPGAAMAFGRARVVDAEGLLMFTAPEAPLAADADTYVALLGSNIIWTPAVALFCRDVLDHVGGFDPRVSAAADYDLYLRVARQYPVAGHAGIVAAYRHHDAAMSKNAAVMLRTTLAVHRRQWRYARHDPNLRRAYRAGRRFWQRFFGDQLMDGIRSQLARGSYRAAVQGLLTMARWSPRRLAWHVGRWLRHSFAKFRPAAPRYRQP
jgi:glycosyltransferase involved in cell wall biosynthesis